MATLEERLARLEGLVVPDSFPSFGTVPVTETFMGLHDRAHSLIYLAGVLGGGLSVAPSASIDPVVSGRLYALPLYISTPRRADQATFRVDTLAAGYARIGLYDVGDRVSLYPGRRLYDFGEVSTGTTGVKVITVSPVQTIPRGLSWLVIELSNRAYLSALPTQDQWMLLGNNPTLAVGYSGWTKSLTYGPLPEVFPSGGSLQTTMPICGLRFIE